jgi:hypothetical protein
MVREFDLDFDKILDVYELEEILNENDLTFADVLKILYENGYIELPQLPL